MTPPGDCDDRLCLVSRPEVNERWDFELLAEYVRECAPDIAPLVVGDQPVEGDLGRADTPRTMTFSPAPIRFFRANRGAVFQGRALRKSEEYEALERFGVPAPRLGAPHADAGPRSVGVRSAFYDIRPPNAEMITLSVAIGIALVLSCSVVPAARLGTFDIVRMLRD